jgi:hypothetical protein
VMLAGTEDARYPFWSPDNRKVAFFARSRLRSVDAVGGPVLSICEATDGRGGTWNADGVIVFAPGPTDPLYRVASTGGRAVRVTSFDTTHSESSHRWPFFLPDGNRFLYSTLTGTGTASDNDVVRIAALDSSVQEVLFSGSTNVEYSRGHLLFVSQGSLMTRPFDPDKRKFTGDPVPVAEEIIFATPYARGSFSTSRTGVLILQSGQNQSWHAAVFSLTGTPLRSVDVESPNAPRFSPDGRMIIFNAINTAVRSGDIWAADLIRRVSSRLTYSHSLSLNPIMNPAGDSIVFGNNRNGVFDLFIKGINGTEERPLVISNRNKGVTDFSKDGRYMMYQSTGNPQTKSDVWVLPMTGDRKPFPLLQTEFNEVNAVFSPDGAWIAYNSDETGRFEVYLRRFDGTGAKVQVTNNGARRPLWKGDAHKLYFTSIDRKFQVASLRFTTTAVIVDSVHTLFDLESRNILGTAISDLNHDATAVVSNVSDSRRSEATITLVVNWDEELKKK